MKIKVHPKRIFGRMLYYPMCEVSSLLSQLGKRKDKIIFCFTEADLTLLRRAGVKIEEI